MAYESAGGQAGCDDAKPPTHRSGSSRFNSIFGEPKMSEIPMRRTPANNPPANEAPADRYVLVPEPTEPLPALNAPEGLLSWVASVDHKLLGIMYILTSVFFF